MSGTYVFEDHSELSGIGIRTHAQIDTELDQLLLQVQNLGSRRWRVYTTNFTADMLDQAVLDIPTQQYVFPVLLGEETPGVSYDFRESEILRVNVMGMDQVVGDNVLLDATGNAVLITLPNDQTLWPAHIGLPFRLEYLK